MKQLLNEAAIGLWYLMCACVASIILFGCVFFILKMSTWVLF